MNTASEVKNQWIKEWVSVLPDSVGIFDREFSFHPSASLKSNPLPADVIKDLESKIRTHDFSSKSECLIKTKVISKSYEIRIEKLDFKNDVFHYCKLNDVTVLENISSELELAKSQQINIARLTELAELAGGISHEISNPLTVVMAKISYLQAKFAEIDLGKDRVKIIEALEKIIHHSDRINKIIKGLKNFSRNDERDLFVKADLKDLLDEALILTIDNLKLRGIFLDTSGFNGKYSVMCHSVQIVQVFVNLLKNSYDALEKISYPKIKIWSEADATSIKLFFEDNGSGIPVDIQSKIFSPFFTTKPFGKGTGLGLSLSQHIIRQHNGTLTLETERSPSCFCIQLPLAIVRPA